MNTHKCVVTTLYKYPRNDCGMMCKIVVYIRKYSQLSPSYYLRHRAYNPTLLQTVQAQYFPNVQLIGFLPELCVILNPFVANKIIRMYEKTLVPPNKVQCPCCFTGIFQLCKPGNYFSFKCMKDSIWVIIRECLL